MDHEKIYSRLTKDISEISFKSDAIPSELCLYGPNAVPICVQKSGEILIAAATYGQGRIVVLPHQAYLNSATFKQFVLNCLAWLSVDQRNPVIIHKNLKTLKGILEECKISTTCKESLDGHGTYCCGAANANNPKVILRHVKSGGGLLIAGQAWHWASQHSSQNVFTEYPGNKIIGPAGVFISSQTIRPSIVNITKEIPSIERSCRVFFHHENDRLLLTNGIGYNSLNIIINSQRLFTFDPLVFPVDLPSKIDGHVVAGRLGAGRFVVVANSKVFDNENGRKFLQNVIKWLLNENEKGKILFDCEVKKLECSLKLDHDCVAVTLKDADVFCCCASSTVEPDVVKSFVEEGGGLLWCGQDCHSCDIFMMKKSLAEFPGNKFLNPFGVGILPSTLKGDVALLAKFSPFFKTVKKYFEKTEDAEEPEYDQRLVSECSDFLKSKDFGSCQYVNLLDELVKLAQDCGCLPPCQAKVFRSEKSKFALAILADLHDVLPEKKFLFISPQNCTKTEKQTIITVDIRNQAKQAAWVSTGLYAAPGETVTIIVPMEIVNKGLQVQVGCHSDQLFKKQELKRAPVVVRRVPLTADTLELCYLWGGLIYFLVPGNCDLGQVQVDVQNATRAPFFQLGKHTAEEWRKDIRQHPGPWAELAADSIIMTVPANLVRSLDNPEPLLEMWNEIMREVARLSALPDGFKRPERLVADVQISAGAMHSGYPIMFHDHSAAKLVDATQSKSGGLWGFIHELGHNRQCNKWEIRPHTTEATCNLWSVYIHEKVLNIPRDKAHGNLTPDKRSKRLEEHMENGAKLTNWKVWTALETYLQLQEGFGWEAFMKLHAQYQKLSCESHTNEAKMSTYAEMFSRTVNKNLVPFFKAWGWNIDDKIAHNLSTLEEWQEDPMRRFYENAAFSCTQDA